MPEPARIAVLDLGKTNLKVLLATTEGEAIDFRTQPNVFVVEEPYRAIDIEGIFAWFLDALADLARGSRIGAIIATAHGCSLVLVGADGRPALPMMDYEAPTPPDIDAAYEAEWPRYHSVFAPIGPGAIRPAKQLLWQSRAFGAGFAAARLALSPAQYLAHRLGGRPASEISQIAAQCHLWDVPRQAFSPLLIRRGWDRLFPPFARAGEVLGVIAPALAARTGLHSDTQILCGAHDSNANLFRYRAAGLEDRAVLSTGTWMIGFDRDLPLAKLREDRGMVANVDVDGVPVASTLTMTGREFATLAGPDLADDDAVLVAATALIARGTFALPSFVADDGAFAGSARRGRIIGEPPRDRAQWGALATLYAAFTAHACLETLESRAPVVIDGGFARNRPFASLLAALRPGIPVETSRDADGTALGAALLWKRFARTSPVAPVALDRVAPAACPGLAVAAQQWQRMAEAADPKQH